MACRQLLKLQWTVVLMQIAMHTKVWVHVVLFITHLGYQHGSY